MFHCLQGEWVCSWLKIINLSAQMSLYSIASFFFPVQITGLSTYLCQGCFFTGLWGKGVIFVVVLLVVIFCKLTLLLFLNTGTPCQETWPGISSSDEFRNYNFPKYKPQPLINHAPRYFVFYLKEHMHSYSFEYL